MTLAEKLTAAIKSHGVHFTNLFLHDIKNAGQLTEEFLSHLVDDLSKQVPEMETPEMYDQILSAINLAAEKKIANDYRDYARQITELSVQNAMLKEENAKLKRLSLVPPVDMHTEEGRLKLIK